MFKFALSAAANHIWLERSAMIFSNKASDACAVFHNVETDVRDRICSWAGVHSSPSNRDVVKLGTFDFD